MIFFKIENDTITQATMLDKPKKEAQNWLESRLGGEWVTFSEINGFRANIGDTIDRETGNFIAKKPFSSWVFDRESWNWQAPIAKPNDGKKYSWNEQTTSWVEVVEEKE